MTCEYSNRHTLYKGRQKCLKQVPIKYTSYINADEFLTSFTIKIDGEKIIEKISFYEDGSYAQLLRTVREL